MPSSFQHFVLDHPVAAPVVPLIGFTSDVGLDQMCEVLDDVRGVCSKLVTTDTELAALEEEDE